MPTLEWIGKKSVLNHHREVPYHLLKADPSLSVGDPGSGNLIVQGDNLLALKALLPYYAGKVKCIYIDPPYNTGNENWVYNDAVNSPEMKAWLGKVVGREAEDLSRHDKWLCMMYPRLQLLKQFLREDGAIFISIDDNEVANLRLLLDEVFGLRNWVCTLIWKRRQTPDSRNLNGVSADHEYVYCYKAGATLRFRGEIKDLTKYKNPDNDPRGAWMSDNLTGLANAQERPNLHYDITDPSTGKHYPPHKSRGWIYGPDKMASLVAAGQLLWPKSSKGRPRLKRYLTDMKTERTGFSSMLKAPANVEGTKELGQMLGAKTFAFPKPKRLIMALVEQVTDNDSIVMDSFLGSGTTAQAVLELNLRDGGTRRFIGVEMEENVYRDSCRVRLTKTVLGYTYETDNGREATVQGSGSGYTFCRLGGCLFGTGGQIVPGVRFDALARHVFFSETGQPLPSPRTGSPMIGVHESAAYYLLFNGILGDKRPNGGNVLTASVLETLPFHDGPKVVFGEGCKLAPSRLRRERITFKQIPYQLRTA